MTRAREHLEASRPLFDADEAAHDALLERFLAAAQDGDLEGLVTVNGQPGRLFVGHGEPPFGEAERRGAQRALELLKAGDLSAEEISEAVFGAGEEAGRRPAPQPEGEARVASVLTVDVSTAGSRPSVSCAIQTSSRISELSQGGWLRYQPCEQQSRKHWLGTIRTPSRLVIEARLVCDGE